MANSHWGASVHGAMMSPFNVEVMIIGRFARGRERLGTRLSAPWQLRG